MKALAILAGALALSLPTLKLSSPAFAPGKTIPRKYTCDGANLSPPLRWGSPTRATRSFALLVDDQDAPGGTFTHWIAWGIKPTVRGLAAGAHPPREGLTSFGKVGYGGPCPPPGTPHRYVFRLYALRSPLRLASGASRTEFEAAIRGRVLASATLVGRYGR